MSDTNDIQHPLVPSQLDKDVEAFIAAEAEQMDKEAQDKIYEGLPPAEAAGEDGTVRSESNQEGKNTPAAPPKEPGSDVDRGLERLVQREIELKGREDRVKNTEAENASLKARLQELEGKLPDRNLTEDIGTDPVDVLTKLGHDPDQIVRLILAKKMGDKAPPELRAALEKAESKKEVARLRDEVTRYQQAQSAQRFVAEVEAGARTYIQQGVSKDAPTVAEVAKANPDRVHREIMEEIAAEARAKMGRNSDGKVLSYEEAAKRVETRWTELKKLLVPTPTASTTDTKKTASGTPSASPNKPQPPPRPLYPWKAKDSDELETQGLQAALAEYRRVESEKRR